MSKNKIEHDVRSAISSLLSAVELIKDEWKSNPDLVDRIIPLSENKLTELKSHLENYNKNNQ